MRNGHLPRPHDPEKSDTVQPIKMTINDDGGLERAEGSTGLPTRVQPGAANLTPRGPTRDPVAVKRDGEKVAAGSHHRRDRAAGMPPAEPPHGNPNVCRALPSVRRREGLRAPTPKVTCVQGGGAAQESGHLLLGHQLSHWSGPCREALKALHTSSAPAQSPGRPRRGAPGCRWKALAEGGRTASCCCTAASREAV